MDSHGSVSVGQAILFSIGLLPVIFVVAIGMAARAGRRSLCSLWPRAE